MYRGLSTLELLIALTVMTSMVIAVTQLTFGMPTVLENVHLERAAYGRASALLAEAERAASISFESVSDIASTTETGIETARTVSFLYDELAALVTATAAWRDARDNPASISLSTLITDPERARDLSCSPFLSSDWSRPQILSTYRLESGALLPPDLPPENYPISSLAILGKVMAVSSDSTATATSSSLFFFTFEESRSEPVLTAAFDNAPVSRTGYAAVTVGGTHAYAANGFGSASAATCAQPSSCAQVHIFGLSDPASPEWIASLELATSAPPHARTTSGSTAAAKSMSYRSGYLYLGLEKTASGSEFNIIDVRDPSHPRWVGGLPIGRSVEAIAVTRTRAYLATSDSSGELVVVDISDPANPVRIGNWDAPGASNFGIGNSISVRGPYAYFGRSYTSNAAEFAFLDVSDPAAIASLAEEDTGTRSDPASVQGTVVRGEVAAILSGGALHFLDALYPSLLRPFAPSLQLAGNGAVLACTGDMLVVGSNDSAGKGVLQVITGS